MKKVNLVTIELKKVYFCGEAVKTNAFYIILTFIPKSNRTFASGCQIDSYSFVDDNNFYLTKI